MSSFSIKLALIKDEDDYEPPARRPVQQPVLMRTGRTHENTNMNVRARQRNDEESSYSRRVLPPPVAPHSYSQTRNQYGNGQYNSSRPTAVGRPPPSGIRCGDCGNVFNNPSARYCPQCGSRR
jgi:rubrerythrin